MNRKAPENQIALLNGLRLLISIFSFKLAKPSKLTSPSSVVTYLELALPLSGRGRDWNAGLK